jgi:thioredoxin-like negative regulator of GroEL
VEDHPRPLEELRRVLTRRKAYVAQERGDEEVRAGQFDDAMASYSTAWALAPDLVELKFWPAVSFFAASRQTEALDLFGTVFAQEPFWADLIPTLVARGWLPNDPGTVQRITSRGE